MKQSDMNHLRRLLGWIRCDIGQAPAELQQTMIDVAAGLGHPEISQEAKARMVETYRRAEAIPLYVRAAVKALEKALPKGGPEGGAATPHATAESRAVVDVAPGAAGWPAQPLSDVAMEQGLAEVGITVWGPRAEDWAAGAEYAVRLMRECLPKAAAETLPDRPDAAGNSAACRDTPAAPPTLRRDEGGGVGAAGQGDNDGGDCAKGARDATGRTPIDYAVEHAEYLAVAAEHLIFSMHKVDECTDMHDEDDSVLTEHDLEVARERCTEATNSLRSRIHEFRKRRDRAALASQKSEGEAC